MLRMEDRRSQRVRERAYRLAESGLHQSWRSVAETLIGEGWPDSQRVMASEYVRRSIDSRCAAARLPEESPAF